MRWVLILTVLFLFLWNTSVVSAGLVNISKDGMLTWNVLADQDSLALEIQPRSQLEVKESAGGNTSDSSLLLKKEDEKIVLNIGEKKVLDVTNWSDSVVDIEENEDSKNIKIQIVDGKFEIIQSNVSAVTTYPININPKENELSVVTNSGAVFLTILPAEAAETALRSRYLSKIIDRNLEMNDQDSGVLVYKVKGEKNINLFNLVELKVPVTTHVSTTTGEILNVDQPKWLSILGFMFS